MRILLRLWGPAGLAVFLALSPGCGEKEKPKPPDKEPEAASEVGVGDAIDYAVGKKQIEIMKHSEEKLDRMKAEHDQRIKEAMGE